MVVGVLRLSLLLHAPQSLKEKRGQVKKVLARCRSRFPVSGAETGSHDLWQRSDLGFAMVDRQQERIQAIFLALEEEVYRSGLAEIVDSQTEYLHFPED